MVYRMTQTQYIWNRYFFLCLFIIEIEMWKKYLVFILDELLNDCVIPAAGNICVLLSAQQSSVSWGAAALVVQCCSDHKGL